MCCIICSAQFYSSFFFFIFFFFNDTATTEIYTLSLHDALPILVLAIVRVVLDRGDPSDGPPVRPCDEVLRYGVLEERVLVGGQQGTDIAAQLRGPQRIAAVVVVGEGDEAIETAPVRNGRDLHCAQTTPSAFPSRAKAPKARSIWSAVWVAIRLVRSRHCDGGTAGGTTGFVNTPASNSLRQNTNVLSSGPISTGTMGVSVGPMSKPSPRRPSCSRRVFSH